MAPKAEMINLYAEDTLAGATISVSNAADNAISDKNQYLSGKKDHPIWGEQKSGMWDEMK